jgi:hypothetical protein
MRHLERLETHAVGLERDGIRIDHRRVTRVGIVCKPIDR